jgi:3-hydroxyisobutyrate dehydrogenase-like beta-hydroxyacid dehydrogenase
MVGGDQALDRAPVLEALVKSIFHLGDTGRRDHEAGDQLLCPSLNVAVSEALVLAERAGLDRATVYDIFEAVPQAHREVQARGIPSTWEGPVCSASLLSPRTKSSSTTWRSKRERVRIRPRRAGTWWPK